ncbi:hypothetical protein [Mucilaginibacter gilvus]|uniref:Uncharacterized protein n=1 Tax=Mucilaginibacter gilvus TaxID=2305909 RepID=A0A444MM08_9SPHI|nr:hypothetical protein [Mucilaginibacter gilvus]RWY50318.1 hypothetical protein EPL05_16360 [Mucilaginibacter gilvus]
MATTHLAKYLSVILYGVSLAVLLFIEVAGMALREILPVGLIVSLSAALILKKKHNSGGLATA